MERAPRPRRCRSPRPSPPVLDRAPWPRTVLRTAARLVPARDAHGRCRCIARRLPGSLSPRTRRARPRGSDRDRGRRASGDARVPRRQRHGVTEHSPTLRSPCNGLRWRGTRPGPRSAGSDTSSATTTAAFTPSSPSSFRPPRFHASSEATAGTWPASSLTGLKPPTAPACCRSDTGPAAPSHRTRARTANSDRLGPASLSSSRDIVEASIEGGGMVPVRPRLHAALGAGSRVRARSLGTRVLL